MPPLRTGPGSKPQKTERTHEENQERAYIAASRRSDRSIEARVESARRASEMHKKRTGRSLRVTEEDVRNEEMYEEEDDDLNQRRLLARQNGDSLVYGARLNAYINSQVAMRVGASQFLGVPFSPNTLQLAGQQLNPQQQMGVYQAGLNQQTSMNNGQSSPSRSWPLSQHQFLQQQQHMFQHQHQQHRQLQQQTLQPHQTMTPGYSQQPSMQGFAQRGQQTTPQHLPDVVATPATQQVTDMFGGQPSPVSMQRNLSDQSHNSSNSNTSNHSNTSNLSTHANRYHPYRNSQAQRLNRASSIAVPQEASYRDQNDVAKLENRRATDPDIQPGPAATLSVSAHDKAMNPPMNRPSAPSFEPGSFSSMPNAMSYLNVSNASLSGQPQNPQGPPYDNYGKITGALPNSFAEIQPSSQGMTNHLDTLLNKTLPMSHSFGGLSGGLSSTLTGNDFNVDSSKFSPGQYETQSGENYFNEAFSLDGSDMFGSVQSNNIDFGDWVDFSASTQTSQT